MAALNLLRPDGDLSASEPSMRESFQFNRLNCGKLPVYVRL